MHNLRTYRAFRERIEEHIKIPPPRHFGQDLLKCPLSAGGKEVPDVFSISKDNGLFLARLRIDGAGWLNGMITSLELNQNSLSIAIYCPTYTYYREIPLTQLADLERYQPPNGTNYVIRDKELVQVKDDNRQAREEDRGHSPAAAMVESIQVRA